jgi:cobalt-zinc-cadmium efflux system membrane fusion protein
MRTILTGVTAAALMLGCSRASDQKPEEKKDSAMAPTTLTLTAAQIAHGKIAWAPVTMGTASASATVPGQITTDEDRTVRLGAPARGRVISVSVSPGDRVTRGQSLVVLQSADAAAAQSDVAKATAALSSRRAQATYAKTAKDRAERLLAMKAVPRQDYDRAVADDELAQSELHESEAELHRARTLADQLGADASSGGTIILRSPQEGVVLSRSGVPGAVVEAGALMVVVTDPSRLWLLVNAPEQFAGLFRTGSQLRFIVPAYPDSFSARITALGAGLEQDTRTLQVRGVVDSRGGRLKPGMLATVAVSGARQMEAALLPDDAVQPMQGKQYVFVAAPDGKGGAQITRREVEVGSRANGQVAVLRGVNAGDVIVTSGAFAVKAEFQKSSMPKMEM